MENSGSHYAWIKNCALNFTNRASVAWSLVACGLGIFTSPSNSAIHLLASCIAGWIVCAMVALMTFPVSPGGRWVLSGACLGLACACVFASTLEFPDSAQVFAKCWMIGALIGGTSLVWIAPVRWLTTRYQTAGSAST